MVHLSVKEQIRTIKQSKRTNFLELKAAHSKCKQRNLTNSHEKAIRVVSLDINVKNAVAKKYYFKVPNKQFYKKPQLFQTFRVSYLVYNRRWSPFLSLYSYFFRLVFQFSFFHPITPSLTLTILSLSNSPNTVFPSLTKTKIWYLQLCTCKIPFNHISYLKPTWFFVALTSGVLFSKPFQQYGRVKFNQSEVSTTNCSGVNYFKPTLRPRREDNLKSFEPFDSKQLILPCIKNFFTKYLH